MQGEIVFACLPQTVGRAGHRRRSRGRCPSAAVRVLLPAALLLLLSSQAHQAASSPDASGQPAAERRVWLPGGRGDQNWCGALLRAVAASLHQVPSEYQASSRPLLCYRTGWLGRRGVRGKLWERRFFVLDADKLRYFVHP